ncbi:sialic acid-binding Ig-like lectin 14 [Phacochoerus africanus]|uniref:sialic acid-binding Ig-like lectin 14 n=1 Tax=Phacochoerus africanus TaxID=41426 RepID=UPI001FD90C08|nr:sialic acid-binding Ig-like lectin 14 [Phacochoerus africanus]
MVPLLLLLLLLLWGGSLQQDQGFWLQVQESVAVQECLGVHVTCSFSFSWSYWSSPGQLFIYWFREGDNTLVGEPVATNNPHRPVNPQTRDRFQLSGDPQNKDCSLSIRDARMSDTGVYVLRLEEGNRVKHTYTDKKLKVQVTALTEKPDIHFLEPLESGRPTNLTCSLPLVCDGGRLVHFSWAGAALDAVDPEALGSSVLTLTPRPQDHGTNLTCQVKLQGAQVTTERTIQLNVSYAPKLMTTRMFQEKVTDLNGTSLPVLEGQSLRLVCGADSNPPAVMSWSREGRAPRPSQPSAPGVLELPHVGADDGGEFTCQAQNPLGSQQVSFHLSVQRSPPSCSCVTEEQQGSWPLVLTLIRGALMGLGFFLAYGLTWMYYTRCGGH